MSVRIMKPPSRNHRHLNQPDVRLRGRRLLETRMRIFTAYAFTCIECREVRPPEQLELDHHIPLHAGGSNDDSNLRPMCAVPCHLDKTRREGR